MKKRLFAPLICLVCLLGFANLTYSQAQTPNQVGLVVSYGNGQVWSSCVSIPTSSATGLEILQKSGLSLILNYTPIGAAVCKIGNVGCPADNCFCASPPDNWNYWHLQGSSWIYSNLGASGSKINSGAVEGWSWGQSSSAQPPLLTFDQICAAQVAPTDTLVPATLTSVPTNTTLPPPDTVAPSNTPPPTSTTAPSNTPLQATKTTVPGKTSLPPTNTLVPSKTPLPTQTPVPASPTSAAQMSVVLETPSETPFIPTSTATTVETTPVEIAAVQGDTATPGSSPTQSSIIPLSTVTLDRVINPTTPATITPDQDTWLSQSGYPIFAVILIGLGILLFIVARRQVR